MWPVRYPSQLHRLCWSLRNSEEERVDIEQDDWVKNQQDSTSMELDGNWLALGSDESYTLIARMHASA